MNVEILNAKLARQYQQGKLTRKYGPDTAAAFEDVLALLLAVTTERELYASKGTRPEKLQGRGEERSLRLNRQFRLIYRLGPDGQGVPTIFVLGIEDYH